MTLNQIRLVKRLLAVVLVSFSALLAYQFLAYYNASKRPSSAALPTNRKDPMARGVEISRLDADGEKVFELRAAESVGANRGNPDISRCGDPIRGRQDGTGSTYGDERSL